jgi:hypothetical protein
MARAISFSHVLAYVASIHAYMVRGKPKTWMAGTSPAMTVGGARRRVHLS